MLHACMQHSQPTLSLRQPQGAALLERLLPDFRLLDAHDLDQGTVHMTGVVPRLSI